MPKETPHEKYIQSAPAFAQPILTKLSQIVHKSCPDVVETMKWSSPHFDHKGILAGMSAFKAHVGFHVWRGKDLDDPDKLFAGVGDTKMSALRLEKLSDIPAERVLVRYLKAAAKLNEEVATKPKSKVAKDKAPAKKNDPTSVEAPADLAAAFKKNAKARKTFEGFSYTNRKEYVDWLTEAKREETRAKRLATAIEWMNEGKSRHWKYQ